MKKILIILSIFFGLHTNDAASQQNQTRTFANAAVLGVSVGMTVEQAISTVRTRLPNIIEWNRSFGQNAGGTRPITSITFRSQAGSQSFTIYFTVAQRVWAIERTVALGGSDSPYAGNFNQQTIDLVGNPSVVWFQSGSQLGLPLQYRFSVWRYEANSGALIRDQPGPAQQCLNMLRVFVNANGGGGPPDVVPGLDAYEAVRTHLQECSRIYFVQMNWTANSVNSDGPVSEFSQFLADARMRASDLEAPYLAMLERARQRQEQLERARQGARPTL
jgi:hypothetical protein